MITKSGCIQRNETKSVWCGKPHKDYQIEAVFHWTAGTCILCLKAIKTNNPNDWAAYPLLERQLQRLIAPQQASTVSQEVAVISQPVVRNWKENCPSCSTEPMTFKGLADYCKTCGYTEIESFRGSY